MTIEQNGNGIDPLVSDTYRELARERTPEALDHEVLRMAARETRTRYAIARAWTRPLAWAATIGLSLVLVLQLADVPVPNPPEAPDAARPDRDIVDPPDAGAPEKRSRADMPLQDEKVGVMNDTPIAAPPAAEAAAKEEEALPLRNFVPADGGPGVRAKSHIQGGLQQAQSQDHLRRQRAAAEQTATPEPAAASSMASFAATAAVDDSELLCPESARATAEQWLECIVAMEETAPAELVDREYQALHERFPELGEVSR